ncbi:MAG: hypothetical protein ABL998_03390 [Planctomycetota bacterium]
MRIPFCQSSSVLVLLALVGLALPARAQRESEFMTEFRKLMAVHAQPEEMGRLIRKHEDQAILAAVEICQAIGSESNDLLEDEIAALNKAWKKTYNSGFVDHIYSFFSVQLSGPFKKQRLQLIDRYNIQRKEFDIASAAKDSGRLTAIGLELNVLGDRFGELGDHYMAAQCYRTYAVCFEDTFNGDKADLKRACEGWGLFLQAREKLELQDKAYADAKVRFEKLEFDGYGDPSKGPEARAAARAATDTAFAPTPMKGAFQLLPDIEAIQRPNYSADANFQIWPSVPLGAVDSSATFPTVSGGPSVLRTGANKASVDVDGDGKGDVEIPLTGKIQPIEITLGNGENQRKWGFLACIGQQRDTYQGFAFNLSPDQNQMGLYVQNAGSLVGTINGVSVRVIDDNFDGLYGSPPKDWAYIGVLEGSFQRDLDSVVVGESKVARPWSKLQKIGEAWFKLEPNETSTDIVATRIELDTGFLQLDLKGAPATWVVVRGTGNNSDYFFDVANGGTNKVEVPIGSYELFVGQVLSGKKQQAMKALILPGSGSRSWKVEKGGTTKVELGAPFGFDFKVAQDEKTLTVQGKTIAVVGRGGETYQRLWNCVLTPEVNVRKEGAKKGKKEAKLVPVGSQEELQDPDGANNDYGYAWFPLGKPIQKPGEGTFEAQLFEKGHKLFGKIESDWKAN